MKITKFGTIAEEHGQLVLAHFEFDCEGEIPSAEAIAEAIAQRIRDEVRIPLFTVNVTPGSFPDFDS